ncbi:MAG: hypothetical protein MRERV_4c076 [Mycoplasmataceae bacterium RV_VA103A]|nr:MAG: hypothetical protein MRERV_11c033 [Mycoplasmataceae bacterium RV_VA103A]KLL05171.1 MAG: hypothetical protein MRERV_4c076 [Mycoplasmataceae bacterium RV_VA103A]
MKKSKENLLIFGAFGLAGYVVFHGHRLGVDCWLCRWRGLTFVAGYLALGAFLSRDD